MRQMPRKTIEYETNEQYPSIVAVDWLKYPELTAVIVFTTTEVAAVNFRDRNDIRCSGKAYEIQNDAIYFDIGQNISEIVEVKGCYDMDE